MQGMDRPIAELVCEDIQRRAQQGEKKYGIKLHANNSRNALQDAYEEALDLCHYLKQRIIEEENRQTHLDAWRQALVIARDHAHVDYEGNVNDKAYWEHEIRAFDREAK